MSPLQQRRTDLGFSLRDVEQITDNRISNAYLSQLENGKIKKPSLAIARDLAAAYAVSMDQMIEWLCEGPVAPPSVLCPTCGQAQPARVANA